MSAAELISTGILMGTLHVLTGPDHLSALATLSSTDLSSRAKRNEEQDIQPRKFDCRAFLLGVRWGVGHSMGLIVVGGILIGIQEGTTSGEWIGLNNWVTNMLESFVGIFMIGLGSYGAMKALTNREYIRKTSSTASSSSRSGSKMRRNSRSMGTCSSGEGTMPSDNKTKKNRAAVKNNLVVMGAGGIELPAHGGRDSIIDQMSSALNTRSSHIDTLWGEDEDGKHMSDTDRRLWIASKSFTENMNMYASDDDMSCCKSRSDSVVTIPMSGLMMDDLQKMYNNANESLSNSMNLNDSHRNVSALFDDFDTADDDTIPRGSNHMQFSVPTAFGDSSDGDVVSSQKRRYRYKYFICTPSALALLTGLVHGVAGPGGVLGIIPAVQMQDVGLAITYLGTFCITSTLVMGCFAAFYGRMCYWMTDGDDNIDKNARVNRIFLVEFGSACLSIIVGIVWLTLLAVGELNEVFP